MRSPWPRSGLWRHGDFLRLWSAETVSQLGTQVSLLALPLAAILVLDASAFEVALLGVFEFLPFILISLPAGVWVDRLPRRPILVIADLGRAATLASVPLAYAFDSLTIWQLYGVGLVTGILTVFFDVAYQSYLPSLVNRDQLVEGNAKLEVSRAGAQIGGPAFAGGLVEAVAAPTAILVDAVSFLLSALFLFRIRKRETVATAEAVERAGMRRELGEGLRYVLGHRLLRPIAACTGSANFFGSIAFSILLVFCVRDLGLSPGLIGIALALGNVGWLLAAVSATRISQRFGVGRTIVGSAVLFGVAWLPVPAAPDGNAALPFLIGAVVIGGFGSVVYNITQVSLRQAIAPERIQGRMNAVMRFLVWGTLPLGSLVGGALASSIGLRETLWISAIGGALTFLPVLFSPVRSVLVIPDVSEEEGDAPPLLEAPAPAPRYGDV